MSFGSIEALEAALTKAAVKAVTEVEKEVYEEFAGNLNQFYTEFSPAEYIRTGALYNSLNRTGVKSSGNGASAKVYFSEPGYQKGQLPIKSTPETGRMGYAEWDDGKIFDYAMNRGSHGGYAFGTSIWNESINSLGNIKGKLYSTFKAAL